MYILSQLDPDLLCSTCHSYMAGTASSMPVRVIYEMIKGRHE